jgi:RNA polymerase sporulation-specific sigma factor
MDIPNVKLLSQEETFFQIKLAQNGDQEALDMLVEHNLKLVLKVTYRFKNTGYDLQDLFQIGVIGLIKAVKAFDLERNLRFSTYAVSRIIGEIRLHLRDDGLIKISRSLKKIAHEVKQKEEEIKKNSNHVPGIKELAAETGYTSSEIIQALEANKSPTSIYQNINQNEGNELFLLDSLKERETSDFSKFDKFELIEVLKQLDQRSRQLIYLRYFEDKTQQEIAGYLGITQVQVSRLEKKIIKELRELF